MENRHPTSNTGNGFLLGVIVGVIITLLFTTKKGREILHRLTEEGKDKATALQEEVQERIAVLKQEVTDEVNEIVERDDVFPIEAESSSEGKSESLEKEQQKKPPVKKFFSRKN